MYIYQHKGWPSFQFDQHLISNKLADLRHKQGILLGKMWNHGFTPKLEASLEMLTEDVLKTSEIEGELLDKLQVRSSIAKRLGLEFAGMVSANRNVEGIVEMMLDATQNYQDSLNAEKLYGWHASLFPTGYSGMVKIVTGSWRDDSTGPMQVVSGPMGRERVHFQAPDAHLLASEMEKFIHWYNSSKSIDPVLEAAIAHIWFITLHPFDDGNGRIARALTDKKLAQAEKSKFRFYSMSNQIRKEREDYYKILEQTQRSDLNISDWLIWFFDCLDRAIENSTEILAAVLKRSAFWNTYSFHNFNERQKKILSLLLDHFKGNLTTAKWAKICKCSHDTANRDIKELIQWGILEKGPKSGRSTNYLMTEIPIT